MNYLSGHDRAARKSLAAAVCTADTAGLKYEAVWASRSMGEWFGGDMLSTATAQAFEGIQIYTLH